MDGTAQQRADPAAAVLRRLQAEKGFSSRSLAAATKEIDGKGLSASYIRNVARGDDLPSADALRLLAQALDANPNEFAEYRLALARRLFDEREIGLAEALGNLSQLDAALGAASEVALDSAAAPASSRSSRSGSARSSSPRKGQAG